MEKFPKPNISENTQKNEEISFAPEGWENNYVISKELGIGESTTTKTVDKYHQDHPEYFAQYKDRMGRIREHYSPELVEIIREKAQKYEAAPEGWQTRGSLARELKISNNTVEGIGNKYRESNPEYFASYKSKKGLVAEHYSPELIEKIKEESQTYGAAPQDWETKSSLAKILGTNKDVLKKIADQYRESNPEYFASYKSKKGLVTEHYSPEFVKIIYNEMEKYEMAPKDWKTAGSLMEGLKVASITIVKIADKYRLSNPEYFRQLKDTMGKVREHYSPELIDNIKKEINKIPVAEEGWRTSKTLSIELGVAQPTIQKIADLYRISNQEYFKVFKNKGGIAYGHYSPELVEIIREQVNKTEKVPEGWKTYTATASQLEVDPSGILKISEKYRNNNPEYFHYYKDRAGNSREHYSPELIEIIKKEIVKRNDSIFEAPEDWKTKEDLAQEMGISLEDINKAAAKLKKEFPNKFGNFKGKE